ncbi:outer membrane protein assembly factor BamD [Sphaerotilus microaerophilus]|jgi:outer membrane protein assembly factor BamD|uniref:Outer membrane protein assembly factor BamD n=1 Tax=Sphaerotilus microaerophilus TaxID=2914710 RepID=A0ABM7YQA9_9BURK|nr:outer membrane protein assembly factor BamD [Sphaerotilus sp. FB-5]BDI06730.1 outer membrane protein assembly factor BamD [Sphaerotilus sp. FB-5]
MFKLSAGLPARTAAWVMAALLATLLGACATDPKKGDDAKAVAKLYEEAREEAAAGAYDAAIKLYERLEGQAAGTLLAQQAQLEQAYLLYKQQEKARALSVVERFLRLHPTSPAADYALYLQGLINFNDDLGLFGNLIKQDLSERDQQASRDAYSAFKQLVERFPESKYAPDAVLRMKYIIATLAGYEVHVARYYYERGAYVAAANRAQQALQDYRGVPAAEEALYLMVASYEKLGLPQLRDDALRVLKNNYPKSAWLQRGYEVQQQKGWWPF